MLDSIKQALWLQFGASIDMLKNAIAGWPEDRWTGNKFFYTSYHVLVFLDYYLTIPPTGFTPALPFTLTEKAKAPAEALDDVIPDRLYTQQELLAWLEASREKCHTLIKNLTEETAQQRWIEEDGDMSYPMLELLLYNMRHVQHHAAQLNLFLRKELNDAPGWVSRAKDEL